MVHLAYFDDKEKIWEKMAQKMSMPDRIFRSS